MSVHHIRWSHHICTCLYLGNCDLSQFVQSQVIVHIVSFQDSAVAMTGVLTHTDITDVVKIRHFFLCLLQCSLNNTITGIGSASHFIFVIRNTEQHNTANTCICHLLQDLRHPIQRITELSRHGRDLFLFILPIHYKHGIYKRAFVHPCLSYHFSKLC